MIAKTSRMNGRSHIAHEAAADRSRLSRTLVNLQLRARVVRALRRFFDDRGYLEVETPCRIPAPAPERHIDAQESGDRYLQTSPELCMKRLLAAGYASVFQICRCFRKGERGQFHLPEFSLLEWYRCRAGYLDLMDETEDLICTVAREIGLRGCMTYQKRSIELSPPWNRLTVGEAFDRFASVSMAQALEDGSFDRVMGLDIAPCLGLEKPVFLYDYPAPHAALARLSPRNRTIAERFELYIAGIELSNGCTELIDPKEQRGRFENERDARKKRGQPVYPMPEMFLKSMKYMPVSAGNALGIDRLVMLLADAAGIDDVVAFAADTT